MRTKNLWMLAAILICCTMTMLTSCSVNDNSVDIITPADENVARITETIRYEEKKATGSALVQTPSGRMCLF